MELWTILLTTSLLAVAVKLLLTIAGGIKTRRRLPPGPPFVSIISSLQLLRNPISNFAPHLRRLADRYGPIFTLHIGSHPAIFVADRHLAHRLLVHHGATLAGRPKPHKALAFLTKNSCNINRTTYGPLWRLLRRNLVSEILHPSKVKLYSSARTWVLGILFEKLRSQAEGNKDGVVVPMEAFQHAMFCLLVFMCFGERLDEDAIGRIKQTQRSLLRYLAKVQVSAFFPWIARYLFPKTWDGLMDLRRQQKEIYLPLIESRRSVRWNPQVDEGKHKFEFSYVDSLLGLDLPDDGRKLINDEIVGLCSEFLNAGTDTTSTALQWIMANIVKHPHVQKKLIEEISGVVSDEEEIKEEDLHKMPYLKAVVLEGLRRHPPAQFVLPHTAIEDIVVDGYLIPKEVRVNFTVAEMGRDGKTWEDPLEFKPERFMPGGEGEGVDITGSREIKMMPFGVGRRICPGLNLALLHLEFFVANLVMAFEWKQVGDEEIDLSEKTEFTIVMKNPLRVAISPRIRR